MAGPGKKEVSKQIARIVGTNLARLREAKQLSQEEVANLAGLHRTEISLMELGKRTVRIDTILRVTGALGINPAEAFAGASWIPFPDRPGGELRVDDQRSKPSGEQSDDD
jgi:transcriptional regulator with XRE-family HTH domain